MTRRILTFVQRLALTFWLGEMLFFIIIFAPRVFKVLERPEAAKLQAAIFPAYFLGGVIAGTIFILSTFAQSRAATGVQRAYRLILPLSLAALLVFIYSRWWITPELNALQPQVLAANVSAEIRSQFDQLHRLSVHLNGGALLCLLVILFLF
jgi:hypothetical protein